MAIPPGAIIPGSLPEFRIYILSPTGSYILWAEDGNNVTPERLTKLGQSGGKEVFVDLDEELKYEEYLEENLGNILDNDLPSNEQKAEIFSRVSTNVVKDAFRTSLGMGTMDEDALRRTQQMIKNAIKFITESNSLRALTKMIGHDYQTYEHATKVLWFTVAFLRDNPDVVKRIDPLYEEYDSSQKKEMLRQCGVAALLHDIGKAFISQEVLNKDGPLNDVEWEMVKRHPLSGLAMLVDTDVPAFVKKAVLHHHEDFDGGGYPMRIEGPNISELARVLRIVDVFDAMTSSRPYKAAIPPLEAAQIMTRSAGLAATEGDDAAVDQRDQGMRRCFDDRLLRKFILFLGNMRLNE
jgi:HD-GYP domain-containing protein (c-di-GMP phosphodiesterase class II)